MPWHALFTSQAPHVESGGPLRADAVVLGAHQTRFALAGGSLRTSTRNEIGAVITFRVDAHTNARTRFVDSTSVERDRVTLPSV